MPVPKPSPKLKLLSHFAEVAKALAHPVRLELLEALSQGERGVEALAQACAQSIANTSHHLKILRLSGLAVSRKEGLQVIYSLADDAIPGVIAAIRGVAERQSAEVERIVRDSFERRDALDPVGRDELLDRVKRGEVIVLDVRPPQEYSAGHIPGAVNIPLEELSRRLASLSRKREIVAYCRGPYCLLAFDAVAQLRKSGYRARRLQDGFPEWKAEHRPVATQENA
ncbi:ArsR/SmtB family transcription factor [Sulfuritalea hydrogenivorans]|jgi:rhodanese-related sulfurtransferase|uniref:ArsR family transcriptional regulator n=1 Tax=Sulfuritalea hydrogenivorans sk43H TaxID=1223802 RepID=W0SC34_9PROT|nr:metalloregulator ArsR/SmtB family transcription factor [Sulfuritalea hydrogenivorans]MDK9714994.1 metalloregulator ArsR/SmtB family transcription factor [Sulfuritalea sp.]BAO28784.1 ArsR family transcriptional regulator [Sulfuritalea hydrogenivorans sk43H]